jgi:hypothetical protein
MQIHLTIDEFNLLNEILEDENRMSRSEPYPQATPEAYLRDKLRIGRDLFGQRLSRNLELGFDELEDLADSLHLRTRTLTADISRAGDPESGSNLERKRGMLEHLLEKVTEACAML